MHGFSAVTDIAEVIGFYFCSHVRDAEIRRLSYCRCTYGQPLMDESQAHTGDNIWFHLFMSRSELAWQ